MVLRVFGITKDYWVWIFPLSGFTLGWWLDKKETERMITYRDRSALYGRDTTAPDYKPSWPKISGMLIFLAVVIFLLITHEESDPNIIKNGRDIPDPEKPLPPSSSKLYKFKHAAISTDSQECSDIARKLMERHANGFDLALNSLICMSLTNIQSCGLFGGFLLTAYIPSEQKSIVIDAQMTSPKNFHFTPKQEGEDYLKVKEGPMSIANSGFLKGLWEIHRNYSKMSWHDIIDPVILLCREGIVLTKHLRDSIEMNSHILNDTYFRNIFIDSSSGRIKRVGSKVVLLKQCDFLELLSKQNTTEDIFSGDVGKLLADDLKTANAIVDINDLQTYKVKVYEARKFDLINDNVLLVPNTCAILIPAILNILMKYNFNSTWFDSQHNTNLSILMHHRIIETFKHVFAMRSEMSDSDFMDTENIINYLLSNDFAYNVIKSINDSFVKPYLQDYNLSTIVPQNHGTSHISIVAENNDLISVTSSINFYFGSGIIGSKSGLIFNNGMDDFSYFNRSVNYFGLKETPTNFPEPQKRALSSVAPLIIINKNNERSNLIIGAAGGSKIITSISMAILRFLYDSTDLKEIIDAPRFHHQLIPNILEYEYGNLMWIINGLNEKGHNSSRYRYRGTIINALKIDQRKIHAISDYRKDSSGVAGF
ncbi:hypothetical protein PVAND_012056 [Polypedilum vanderplanki]|uniref:Complex I-MNLL n=1 Tax=Polypedilum vanderplanki TaxID=319348 RepID=A0A9J6CKF6_POLVA|nr:hypothetical protein PVAND_012056 [Polypedilum vanderplanki]